MSNFGFAAKLCLGLLAGAAVGTAAPATVTFGSLTASTSSKAFAQRGAASTNANDVKSNTLLVLPALPGVVVSASTAFVIGGGTNFVQSSASSTTSVYFFDAGNAVFDMSSDNSIVQRAASSGPNPIKGTANSGGYDLVYAFSLSGPASLLLNYDLDDPFGIAGNTVLAQLIGPSGAFLNNLPINSSGSISSLLSAGNYSLHLKSAFENNIARIGTGPGTTKGGSFDHFALTITPSVPEPASWAMMIAGFAVAGAAMRRKIPVTLMRTGASLA